MADERAPAPPDLDVNARLAAIVECSDDAIVSKTLDGIVTSWNKGAERIFGYTAAEIVGRPMTTIFPPERYEEEVHILRRLQAGERVDHFETVRVSKDGRLVEVSVTISPIRDVSGRIVGASKIARDITDQKRIERELRRTRDEAEAASRAKDHFLSVLSHELRTPLTPVLAAISMIEAGGPITAEELRGHVGMIRRNVETEARLVDDLLDITRISRGKVRLHMEAVDAHAAVRAVVAMLQGEIDARRLDVTLSLRARDRHVWADAGRFQQVLLNLLSNAVKFTPAEGAVTLRTANEEGEGRRLRIEVSDTGIGIDAQTMPRLFNAFEQGEQTVTRRFGGLGLGLSIVRSLMDLHGGSVAAASEGTGKGASFTLRLATVSPSMDAGANPTAGSPAAVGGRQIRVLLVEDHTDTREMLSQMLASFGCHVRAAASVHDALELAGSGEFDLLVSDIGLPDGTGHDVMRHVRASRQIKGIALSGFGQEDDLRRSREAGFERHLTKPVSVQTLSEVIREVAGA